MSPFQLTAVLLLGAGAAEAAAPEPATIMRIQGRAERSPLEGNVVLTEGIVTLCSRNGRRCWLQHPDGDGDPATSDGVALHLAGRQTGSRLRPGDRVRVQGRVRERQFGAGLPLTEITRIRELQVLGRDHPLPSPVTVTRLPDVAVNDAIAFWERLEGMRVQVAEAVAVAPTNRFGEFTVLAAANAQPGSGYQPVNHHLLLRPLPDGNVDYNPERIIVDDEASAAPDVHPGDRFHDLVGVVDYAFGNYKLQRQHGRQVTRKRAEAKPAPTPTPTPNGLRLASLNLQNLFDTEPAPDKEDGRSTPSPERLRIKLSKLAHTIVDILRTPEIIAVQEAENTAVLESLAQLINRNHGNDYRAVSFDSSDPRGIEVGLLWDSKRIRLRHAEPLGARASRAAFGAHSVSPGREPLVGEFEYRGRLLTVVVNHFKSKRGDDPLFGARQPPRRPTEMQRKQQAHAVRAFVDRRLHENPDALIAVVGDLNDFPFTEPGEGDDHPLAILGGKGDRALEDLSARLPPAERYSFIHDGNSQLLDYVMVSPALRPLVEAVEIAHVNASYPARFAEDPNAPHRASDHDPVTATLRLH